MRLDKNYLPYEYFDKLKVFEEVEVLEGVNIIKLPTETGIYFLSRMKAGTSLVEHYHNSKEYCYIKKGKIVLNDNITLEEGSSFYFKAFDIHNIKAIEECELYVQLSKDEHFKKFK